MADIYINPSTGSDASGDGSIGNPYATFANVNGSQWLRGNTINVARGTRMLVTTGTRANIEVTMGTGRCVLQAYGTGDRPIIDGGYSTHNPVWVRNGSGIDILDIQVTRSAALGVKVSPLSGNTVDDVTLTRVHAFENGLVGSTGAAATGIMVTRESGGVACTNVILRDCDSHDNRGHGIKFTDCAKGRVIKSRAYRNGQGAPAHGMGTVGGYIWINQSNAWINTIGNIWSITISALGGAGAGMPSATQNVTDWLLVTAGDSSSVTIASRAHLTKSATPTTPGANEFGINGTNTLLVNFNGLDPRTLFVKAAYAHPDVTFEQCVAAYTKDWDGNEGSGFQFDDLTIGCRVKDCISANNEGYGFVGFGGAYNVCMQSVIVGNAKGGAFSLIARNMSIVGNEIFGNGGAAIESFKGANIRATGNRIIGHTTGFKSNNASEFVILEDGNQYMDVLTLRVNVSPGEKTAHIATRHMLNLAGLPDSATVS